MTGYEDGRKFHSGNHRRHLRHDCSPRNLYLLLWLPVAAASKGEGKHSEDDDGDDWVRGQRTTAADEHQTKPRQTADCERGGIAKGRHSGLWSLRDCVQRSCEREAFWVMEPS